MTKKHFEHAAKIVSAILAGEWTNDLPDWADVAKTMPIAEDVTSDYLRAMWTAEAFILLFAADNTRFDRARFLFACGIGPKPERRTRV